MTFKGKRPELGWSLHMTGGWRAQLERIRRWHERLRAAAMPVDRYDFLYVFLENAFHLRDWLKDTGAASQADLDALFAGSAEMRLCRDLANSHKHHSLRDPSQPKPPSEAREYAPATGNLGNGESLVILSDGTKHDAFQLADAVMAQWDEFIASKVRSAHDAA
jgi:hypothetical protein